VSLQIVRQVLNTAERGDTIELGLWVEQDTHSSPIPGFSSSKLDFVPIHDVSNTTAPEDNDTLKCIIRVSHKYTLSENHQRENHPRDVVTTEIRPKLAFDTHFLRRILRQIDGDLVSDLPPPDSFTSGRTCDLHIALKRLPTPSTPAAELTDEEMEPSLEQLASFGESLKGKRVTLYATADGSFAHHLTVYLTAWGMDVTHVSPEGQVDGLVDPPTPGSGSYEPRSSYIPLGTGPEPGFSFGASGKADPTQAGSQSPSFIVIDDDVDILKERLQSLRLNQNPQLPVSSGSRKRPSLSAHHRPRSSPQIARVMGLNSAHKQLARVAIIHFTSLGNYKLLKDVMQSMMASFTTSTGLIPEVMIIPKPAGPRRFLTALHTAVTKPPVDSFFLPIATSPMGPSTPLSFGMSFNGSLASEQGTPTFSNSGGSPQSLSPSIKHSNRPHGTRTNSDRSTRSGDSVSKSLANVLHSPLALPDNVEYFSATSQRLGSSPSSGLVIQSPDGQPAGIYFHPRSKTSRTASSQAMERDRGQLSVPPSRRMSTSRMASGGQKDDHLTVSSFHGVYQAPISPMAGNENQMSSSSSIIPGKQLNTMSSLSHEIERLSHEIEPQPSLSILSPVPRKLSIASRKNSSPSTSPTRGTSSRRGLGKRSSAESKDSLTPSASSKQKGKFLASDTNVVPPISVLIVDGMLCFRFDLSIFDVFRD
jgi:osomolarity two-component system response regulator SSK1